jgi:hypothetical protein
MFRLAATPGNCPEYLAGISEAAKAAVESTAKPAATVAERRPPAAEATALSDIAILSEERMIRQSIDPTAILDHPFAAAKHPPSNPIGALGNPVSLLPHDVSEPCEGRKAQVMKIAEADLKVLRFQWVPREM